MKRQMTERLRSSLKLLAVSVSVLAVSASLCSATIGPIDSVATDNPPGSPPYNILSITVGNYTVNVDQLGTGTSTTTLDPIGGTLLPVIDDFELSLTYIAGETTDAFTVHMFGGKLWKNSNGDNPDFFVFEAGGNDSPDLAAILPGGVIGQTVTVSSGLWGGMGAGYNGTNGQEIFGVSFAITDLLDASGVPLTNSSVIEGLAIPSRNGLDPGAWFAVMPPLTLAQDPIPANESTDVDRDVILGWQPSETANTHNVYFGTVWEDVNAASTTNPLDVLVSQGQDTTNWDPGRLEFDQTYYWRVDEVNGAPDFTLFKGEVWSFTAEPFSVPISNITATASSSFGASGPEKTIDGSGLADDVHGVAASDMWISGAIPATIEYAFDRAYKLHELWIWNSNQLIESFVGFGGKDVVIEYSVDGENWTVLEGVGPLAQAPGTDGYAHNNTISFGGAMARHVRVTINSVQGIAPQASLSEVRFYYIPVNAREPQPASGSVDVPPTTHLSWRAGREAASHDVHLGTDATDLPLVGNVTQSSFDPEPLDLQLSETYSWQIREVNEAETPTTWKGDLWSFTITDAIVVDDMESYRDEEFLEIWATWIDGFDDPANGSLVGGATGTPETGIVHGGSQSLPIWFDNSTAAIAEATRTFDQTQDWTRSGVKTLVLSFSRGVANTGNGRLYVKVNDTKVVHPEDPAALPPVWWTQWNIDLTHLGADLTRVRSLTVGIEGAGAKGVLYVDDIQLEGEASGSQQDLTWFEAEAADILGASWKVVDDLASSGGTHIGSADGDGNENDAAPGPEWIATYNFNAAGGVYKVWLRSQEAGGNSFWVRIRTASSQNVEDPDQVGTGWVRFNGLQAPNGWAWDEVHNDDPSTVVVNWTLAPGAHVLEIGKREDGTLVDTILITNDLD